VSQITTSQLGWQCMFDHGIYTDIPKNLTLIVLKLSSELYWGTLEGIYQSHFMYVFCA
jgi:hypothetical protein